MSSVKNESASFTSFVPKIIYMKPWQLPHTLPFSRIPLIVLLLGCIWQIGKSGYVYTIGLACKFQSGSPCFAYDSVSDGMGDRRSTCKGNGDLIP